MSAFCNYPGGTRFSVFFNYPSGTRFSAFFNYLSGTRLISALCNYSLRLRSGTPETAG
jgi:hypothetical protein